MMARRYWHFLPADRRLRWGTRELVEAGSTIRVEFPYQHNGETYDRPTLCKAGLHASYRAIDALSYAPGPIICRVTLAGDVVEDGDKAVAAERTVLWMADASAVLHEFACRCAEAALRAAGVQDARCWLAIETKRRWLRGEATAQELATAREAAGDAAWGTAWEAAREAARGTAWAAAREEAWEAAGAAAAREASAAAWAAAWEAAWEAREAQNRRITKMLMRLGNK